MFTLAALRKPARARRIATTLWIVWVVIVWNVVFDQVIVLTGQSYVVAALTAANGPGPYLRMDDWMRPAVTRAFWMATGAAIVMIAILVAALRAARSSPRAA